MLSAHPGQPSSLVALVSAPRHRPRESARARVERRLARARALRKRVGVLGAAPVLIVPLLGFARPCGEHVPDGGHRPVLLCGTDFAGRAVHAAALARRRRRVRERGFPARSSCAGTARRPGTPTVGWGLAEEEELRPSDEDE